MKKVLLIGCALLFLGSVVLFAGLAWLGAEMPETYVVYGPNVPKHHLDEIGELKLLEADETLEYFYSDGMFSLGEGVYLVTDRRLVLYCEEWSQPLLTAAWSDIDEIWGSYNDSFFEDSWISVSLKRDDKQWSFPLSSELERDHEVVSYIEERLEETRRARPSEADEREPAPETTGVAGKQSDD